MRRLDLLLFNFLQELVYYKDAEQLLLRVQQLHIADDRQPYTLQATAVGEPIDPERHRMRVDVKAVTLHHFALTQTEQAGRPPSSWIFERINALSGLGFGASG